MQTPFPRTTVGGVSLPRMLIGTNWLAGWSHRTPAADSRIQRHHSAADSIIPLLETFVNNGVDAVMAPFGRVKPVADAVLEAEQRLGKAIIRIDTPIINVDDTAEGRREAAAVIHESQMLGATFCLIHHSSAERLVNKNKGVIERLDDYTAMIRGQGMLPGVTAHMPELVVYCDQNGYDVETYVQLYNCMGFLMQVEVETVAGIIHSAKKPVMTIKPMAAGRVTPYVGLNFSWATLRECDMVTVGCFDEQEAAEVIEISRAALERRFPDLEPRQSPNQNQAAFGR
ncbi:MAG: hypothetical protein LBI19_00990 [Oscillospiraceae bacterium]|jgi:hypothetical protein|nr:hypothetical protein [Oscillospiraceae bacterium]